MRTIIKARGKGKTLELIKEAHATKKYIMSIHREAASRTFRMALELGYDICYPLTYAELEKGAWGNLVEGLLLDDVDMYLSQICRGRLGAITLSMHSPPVAGSDD